MFVYLHVHTRNLALILTMEYVRDILSNRVGYYVRDALSYNELSDFKVYLNRVRSRF